MTRIGPGDQVGPAVGSVFRRNLASRPSRFGVVAAPGGTGPIGPFPPGVESDDQQVEYDKLRRRVLWSFPSGL